MTDAMKTAANNDQPARDGWQFEPETRVISQAMYVLAEEIQSGDGIANAACRQAAERLDAQTVEIERLRAALRTTQEPVAWAIFAESGAIRMWSKHQPHVKKVADAGGLKFSPLYAAPPKAAHGIGVTQTTGEPAPPDVAAAVLAEREACMQLMSDLREKSRNHLFRSALTVAEGEIRARGAPTRLPADDTEGGEAMTDDHEMLELAAKAAGLRIRDWWEKYQGEWWADLVVNDDPPCAIWNPLLDDVDAFRLMVDLGLVVDCSRPSAATPFHTHTTAEIGASDPYAATRRAIVRAAAEIGRQME